MLLIASNTREIGAKQKGGVVKHLNIVGPQIRKLRYNKGWSQSKLATELYMQGLEVQREFVAQVEGQTHCVKDKDLFYFAAALNVPFSDLFPKPATGRSLHEFVTGLLSGRREGNGLSVVMNALQLTRPLHGK